MPNQISSLRISSTRHIRMNKTVLPETQPATGQSKHRPVMCQRPFISLLLRTIRVSTKEDLGVQTEYKLTRISREHSGNIIPRYDKRLLFAYRLLLTTAHI